MRSIGISPYRIKYYHVIIGIATLLLLYQMLLMWSHTVDDAYISLRYAQNYVDGYGLTWNYTGPRVEGYSNFLWVIIMASYLSLGLEGILPAKVIGSIVAIAQLPIIYYIGKNVGLSKNWASIAVLIYCFIPAVPFWAVSGLETPFFTLLFIIAIHHLIKKGEYSNVIASLFFGLAALTRHEGMVLFLTVGAAFFLTRIINDCLRRGVIDSIYFVIPGGFLYTVYFLWRYAYYGYFFPNTVYVKSQSLDGIGSVVRSAAHPLDLFAYLAPLLLLALIGLSIGTKNKYSKKLCRCTIVISVLVGTIGIAAGIIFTPDFVTSRLATDGFIPSSTVRLIQLLRAVSIFIGSIFLLMGVVFQQKPNLVKYLYFVPKADTYAQNSFILATPIIVLLIVSYFISTSMMRGIRFFHPIVPLITILATVGINHVSQNLKKVGAEVNLRSAISVLLIIILINPIGIGATPLLIGSGETELRGGNFNSPIYSIDNFHRFADDYGQNMQEGSVPVGKWLGEHTTRADYIALSEAGAMPYYCRCNTEDIIGLNSYQATHGNRSAQWLLQKEPKFFVLTANNITSFDRSESGFQGEIYSNRQFQTEYELVYIVNHNPNTYRKNYAFWIFTHERNDINELRSSLESSTTAPLVLPSNRTRNVQK